MTLIVDPKWFQSKAKLKLALDENRCYITDPAIMGPWTQTPSALGVGFKEIVTNHPLRTKLATIEKVGPNAWKVT